MFTFPDNSKKPVNLVMQGMAFHLIQNRRCIFLQRNMTYLILVSKHTFSEYLPPWYLCKADVILGVSVRRLLVEINTWMSEAGAQPPVCGLHPIS